MSHDPVKLLVPVPDPLSEPESYSHTISFADTSRPELQSLLQAINHRIASVPNPGSASQIRMRVDAVTTGNDTFPYIAIETMHTLADDLPSVTFSLQLNMEQRSVDAVIEHILIPGSIGTVINVDAVRLYYGTYDSDPSAYVEFPSPFVGVKLPITDRDGTPIPSGAVVEPVFISPIGFSLSDPVEGFITRVASSDLNPPQCWDGLDNDDDGFTDFDGNDPECGYQFDPYEYSNDNDMNVVTRTLVVYNTNAADARTIADHYRSVRLPNQTDDVLCSIQLPPGQFASANDLSNATKAIRRCICENILEDTQANCTDVTGEALAEQSPITHLALIKGIPPRMTGTGWASDAEEPSFDYYLAYSIYNDTPLFGPGEDNCGNQGTLDGCVDHGTFDGGDPDAVDFQPSSSQVSYIRQIDPSLDRLLAYGRIEAINTERTIDLINRTRSAERAGIAGNFISHGFTTTTHEFLATLSSTQNDPAGQYVCDTELYLDDPDLDWDHEHCRAGQTDNGLIPGEQVLGPEDAGKIQSIPYAVNAGLYIGGLPPNSDQGHDAFSGFNNMINWRHEHPNDLPEPCEPLCRDIVDVIEREACRADSTDFFSEINTDCVGAAPGLIGWQFRSWPVQYYGFTPAGWGVDNTSGRVEKTMPQIEAGSPFGDRYLHYGAADAVDHPQCVDSSGSLTHCPELIAISLRKLQTINPAIEFETDKTMRLRFRYRRGGGDTGRIRLNMTFLKQNSNPQEQVTIEEIFDIAQPQTDWTTATADIVIPVAFSPIDRVIAKIIARRNDNIRGYIDLDLIEIFDVDDPTESNLISEDLASFERDHTGPTVGGDWAANAIDRLNGIAWWGSSSHHLTGGFAFANPEKFVGAFYSGRTLGESLMYISGNAKSGIIYGDPTYRPSGAKIYLNEGITPINDPATPLVFTDDPASWEGRELYINAFHGRGGLQQITSSVEFVPNLRPSPAPPGPSITNTQATIIGPITPVPVYQQRWLVSKCYEADVATCDALDSWIHFESSRSFRVGGVFARPLQINPLNPGAMIELADQDHLGENQNIILRLRVWRTNQENDTATAETHNNDLINYAFLQYQPVGQ